MTMTVRTEKSRVLVRGVNWIGDAVMTLPALRVLRSELTESDIHLMVKEWVKPVYFSDPNIDEIVEYRKEYEGIAGNFRAAIYLRKIRYDSAILFQNAFDAAVFVYLAGIKKRIGYDRDARSFFLSSSIPVTGETKKLHHALYYLNLLKEIGMNAIYRDPWIYLDQREREGAEEILRGLRRPVILLNPGATYGSAKRWPNEYFSKLISSVIKNLGGSIVLSGAPSERKLVDEILGECGADVVSEETVLNLSGEISLREFIGVVSKVDIAVTNDSGPMHIAYAVGTPLIALFGSTEPDLTGPPSFVKPERCGFSRDIEFGQKNIVLKKEISCSPCFERECPRGDVACLKMISPDDVYTAIVELIPKQKAIFFDRDGTLCRDAGYLNGMEKFEIYPEVERLHRIKEKGYLLIGISNQSGVSRGLVERSFTEEINGIFIEKYGFDAFYYCPHHPDEYCPCRKPSPGMTLKARRDFNIDFTSSVVVGDKESDMQLARNIDAEGILLSAKEDEKSQSADVVLDELNKVIDYILNK
jgi:heptosyltransferase-2